LNIACTDEAAECRNLYDAEQFSEALTVCEKACNMNNGNGCLTIGGNPVIHQKSEFTP